jgi:hypothetical protein
MPGFSMKVTFRYTLLWLIGGLTVTECHAALATYTFSPSETSVPTVVDLTFGSFQRQNVNQSPAAGVFQSSAWNYGSSINTSEYVQFTISVTPGYQLKLTSLSLDVSSSASGIFGLTGGPNNLQVSVLSGVLALGAGDNNTPLTLQSWSGIKGTTQTIAWNLPDQTSTSGFTVRLYGWSAGIFGGTMSFDNVAVDGSVTPVPEPVTVAAVVFGLIFVGTGFARSRLRRAHAA